MAWARLHDGVLSHPKIVGMFNPRDPFHLWIWGLSYAQQYLTDGVLPREAIPGPARTRQALVQRGLWVPHERGFLVHDFLGWNDSKEVITKKRAEARERMRNVRERTSSERSPPNAALSTSHEVLRGVDLLSLERESERKPFLKSPTDARSKRPIFVGHRLTVFEWILDDLRKVLGPYVSDFGLDEWFYNLDAKAVELNLVMPKRDTGAWLQAQLLEEAKRRGLPIAGAKADCDLDTQFTVAWTCPHCHQVHEGTKAQHQQRATWCPNVVPA